MADEIKSMREYVIWPGGAAYALVRVPGEGDLVDLPTRTANTASPKSAVLKMRPPKPVVDAAISKLESKPDAVEK